MRYQPAINIWEVKDEDRDSLQIGQWVYAGDKSNMGRFYGHGNSTVIAWLNNGRRIGWKNYTKSVYEYGQSVINKA